MHGAMGVYAGRGCFQPGFTEKNERVPITMFLIIFQLKEIVDKIKKVDMKLISV